jgi:hypothetical protein
MLKDTYGFMNTEFEPKETDLVEYLEVLDED